jgi:integrase
VTRRARGDGGLHWDEHRQRWIATTTIGYDGRGKRVVRKASGRTRTEAKNKLRDLLRDQADGLTAGVTGYTVRHAVEDWLAHGLGRQSAATVTKYRHLCAKHVLPALGAWKLRDLSAAEVDQWLAELSLSHSTRTVQEIRACLNRSVKRAMARDKVKRNVVELTEVPTGQAGRRSKSLSAEQADDVLTKTTLDRLHSYIVVSLLTGARTEELRALGWDHVHLDPDSGPPYLEVWRSVRAHGDTKTRKSRRTLALASLCVDALRVQRVQQAKDRLAAGERWTETGLVFTTRLGTGMDAAVTFAAPWPWCPGSIRPTGPRVSYGTPSFRCSPMPACPSGTLRSSSATAAPPSPNWSTGIRSGPSSRPAQRSWIGSSDTAAQVRSHSVGHSPGRCGWFGRPEPVSDLVGDTGFEPVTSSV